MVRRPHALVIPAAVTAILAAAGCGSGVSLDPARTPAAPAGTVMLWDGQPSLDGWKQAGPGGFEIVDAEDGKVLQSQGGLGLLWYHRAAFRDFTLRLDWRVTRATDNSGVFVRFPDAGTDPQVAIDKGYEIQVNDNPDGDPQKTGAIYNAQPPTAANPRPAGEWNRFEITVIGDRYQVLLNDVLVNDFTGDKAGGEGYVGIQNHDPDSRVQYRRIEVVCATDC